MPTEAQLLANRRNAQRSTGPRTSASRARSAMNACKSGIYAKSEIIPGEDPAELEAVKTRIYDSLQPTAEEVPLVDELIGADWQLRRLRRAEADTWTMSINGDREKNRQKGRPEDHEVYYRAIEDNKDTFDRIYRLQASTARVLNRSLEILLRLRKAGLSISPNEANSDPMEERALSPADPEPPKTDETNPIPETVTVPDPAAEDSGPDATPPQNDETNPIPEASVPSPQSLAHGSRPLNPATQPPASTNLNVPNPPGVYPGSITPE